MSLSREEFAHIALEYFRECGEARPLTWDSARHRLVVGGPGDPVSYATLSWAQAEYEEAPPGEQSRVLARRFWSSVRRAQAPRRELMLAQVFPRVRDLAWFSAVRRQMELELGGDEDAIAAVTLPHRALNDELAVHLVFELPTSVMELGADRLAAWGVAFDELYARALENLKGRSTLPFEEPQPGVFLSPYRDALDATRLLLTAQFEALEVKGRPVALAPTHDILMVAGDEDQDGLAAIADWAEQALLEPRAHSAVAFRLEAGAWRPFLPPRAHPAWPKFKVLQLQTLASAYTRQKEVLDELLESNGHELFVAGLRAFRAPTGDIFTAAAWTAGVEALLPQTDRLDFVKLPPDGNADAAQIWSTTFDVARRVVGHLMEPTGDVPERWKVKAFPALEELERMAKEGPLPG